MASHTTRSVTSAYTAQKAIAAQAQADQQRASILTALQKQRAQMVASGVMDGALPSFDEHSSTSDLLSAQQRMNGIAQARTGRAATPPAVVQSTTGAASAAVPTATKRLDTAAAATPGVGGLALQAAGGQAQADAAAPLAGTLAAPNVNLPGRTPMEAAMDAIPFHNGMSGAGATQTGAGMTMVVPSASGPRSVAVNPTFEQKMHAETGGQWGGWTPAQRASYLRSNPATGNDGTVTDPGVTPFNVRGERNVTQNTKDGAATSIEYDPRQDRVLTRTANAAGGFDITSKYGTGTSSAAQPVPLVHPADAAAVAAAPPATMQQMMDAKALQTNLANGTPTGNAMVVTQQTASAPLSGTATPPPGTAPVAPAVAPAGAIAGAVTPITPSGADQLKAAQAAAAAATGKVDAANAADAAAQKDAADAAKAKQIQATPPDPTNKQMREDPNLQNTGPMFGGLTPAGPTIASATPLGSTSMQESPLTAFATSPEDAQFKKRLVDGGDPNDGVA